MPAAAAIDVFVSRRLSSVTSMAKWRVTIPTSPTKRSCSLAVRPSGCRRTKLLNVSMSIGGPGRWLPVPTMRTRTGYSVRMPSRIELRVAWRAAA